MQIERFIEKFDPWSVFPTYVKMSTVVEDCLHSLEIFEWAKPFDLEGIFQESISILADQETRPVAIMMSGEFVSSTFLSSGARKLKDWDPCVSRNLVEQGYLGIYKGVYVFVVPESRLMEGHPGLPFTPFCVIGEDHHIPYHFARFYFPPLD